MFCIIAKSAWNFDEYAVFIWFKKKKWYKKFFHFIIKKKQKNNFEFLFLIIFEKKKKKKNFWQWQYLKSNLKILILNSYNFKLLHSESTSDFVISVWTYVRITCKIFCKISNILEIGIKHLFWTILNCRPCSLHKFTANPFRY